MTESTVLHTVFLAMGSNIEPRYANLQQAMVYIEQNAIVINQRSPIYETRPWGVLSQSDFLNMVVDCETELDPLELLTILKSIEQKMGRQKTIRNGPRNIDIDILLYDQIQIQDDTLSIPHPRMAMRNFVITPLNDLAPELVIPGIDQTVNDLKNILGSDGVKKWKAPNA